jgi:NCAIR mutase (PurE)-related protein
LRLLNFKNLFYLQRKELIMRNGATLEKIEREIKRLTSQEQLKLLERLARQLRKGGIAMKKELDWNKLYGLGKELWRGEDAQEYVNRLREDRI